MSRDQRESMSEERTQEARSELWVVWGPVEKDGRRYPEHCAGWKEACHEHINDAINEHDLEEARQWIVVQHSNEAAALIERQAAEIARMTAFQSSMRCPNCDVVRLQFMEAEADAKEQARLVGMGAERELSAIQRAERAEHAVAALKVENERLALTYMQTKQEADDWKRLAGARLAELRLMDAYVCDAPKCEERGCDGHCNSALPPMSGFIESAEAAEAEVARLTQRIGECEGALQTQEKLTEAAEAEARQLREQLAACERDAARWRMAPMMLGGFMFEELKSDVDAAIDAAMSAKEDR